MLSEKKVEKSVMKIHCILLGLFILYFFLPCALLHYQTTLIGLQVNGQEANQTYTIDENIEVKLLCSFVGWKPPGNVRLSDNRGHEDNSTRHADGLLTLSLGTYLCHDEWPTIRCEASGSELNKTMTALITCLAQFSDLTGEVLVVPRTNEVGKSINTKSHTNTLKCLIRDLKQKFPEKEVHCKITGRPPFHNLTLIATDWLEEDVRASSNREIWKTILLIMSSCLLGASIFTAAVIVCVVYRRQLGLMKSAVGSNYFAGRMRSPPLLKKYTNDSSDNITAASAATIEHKTPGRKNSDGMVYGELDFSDKISSDVIIGSLPETQYAHINFTATVNACK